MILPLTCGHCGSCVKCRLAAKHPDYARLFGVGAASLRPTKVSLPCIYAGDELTGYERDAAGLQHGKRWLHCEHPLPPLGPVVCPCKGCGPSCPGFRSEESSHTWLQFDHENLAPGEPGIRFNAGLLPWKDGYLLAWRDNERNSRVWLSCLDVAFRPTGTPLLLQLKHAEAEHSQEDPRLFLFRGVPHVMFVGAASRNSVLRTSVLYARLDPTTLQAEEVFYPHYEGRNFWEKNWGFFEHEAQLYAVYSISPHVILKIDGDKAVPAYETPTLATWPTGELRGSTPPMRVDDEYWAFYHSSVARHLKGVPGHRVYDVGLYTFNPSPPFRVRRITLEPFLTADQSTRPAGQSKSVVFPCGAICRGKDIVLSAGVHDRWIELLGYKRQELEQKLAEISPPEWWSLNEQLVQDWDIWSSVAGRDEYGLARFELQDAAVLDVGAHIGSFVYAANQRGAKVIHCYEPEPGSFQHLAKNAKMFENVRVHQAAVGGYISDASFRITDKLTQPEVVPLDKAILDLAAVSPSGKVDLLKIDCERGEWPAFREAKRLDLVERIVGEWHRAFWEGRWWGPEDLPTLLEPHGFVVSYPLAAGTHGEFTAVRNR